MHLTGICLNNGNPKSTGISLRGLFCTLYFAASAVVSICFLKLYARMSFIIREKDFEYISGIYINLSPLFILLALVNLVLFSLGITYRTKLSFFGSLVLINALSAFLFISCPDLSIFNFNHFLY